MFVTEKIYSIIPVSLSGAHKFYTTLTNFLSVLGYWASMFCAVVLVEHFVFRRGSFESYDVRHWNLPRHLPSGLAALAACVIACGMVVPSMDQTWWVGPIGKNTGDLGFELAFVTTGVMYTITRKVELFLRRGKSHEDEQRT
jgi:purine-cytosine permease-like protein